MAVTFRELQGSPTFSLDQNGWRGQRIVKIAWQDIDAFIAELIPPTTGQGTIQQSHVTFPGKPWLFLTSMQIDPFDPENPQTADSDGVNTYDLVDGSGNVLAIDDNSGARVTLGYQTTEYSGSSEQDDPVPYLTTRWNVSGEFLTMKGAGLKWDSDSQPASEEGGIVKIVAQVEMVLTWHFVNNPPLTAIRANINRVNSGSFLGADSETLMFAGAGITREIMTNGDRSFTMEYRFLERIIAADSTDIVGSDTPGWNHSFRTTGSNAGKWERVNTASGGKPYPAVTTFGNLFQSG